MSNIRYNVFPGTAVKTLSTIVRHLKNTIEIDT